MLIDTLSDLSVKEIRVTTLDPYFKELVSGGNFKSTKSIYAYLETVILEGLSNREKYEHCSWLKSEIERLKNFKKK